MALYNSFQYNQLNFNGFTLSDQVNMTDANTTELNTALSDFVFSEDMVTINFANKALNDTVKTAEWLGGKQNPQSDNWGD